jgi:hypothetical protein
MRFSERNRWRDIAIKERREIARAFVERIIVPDDEIEFIYRFRGSSERSAKSQQSPAPTSSGSKTKEASTEPFSIPLPKPGHRCPRTGMTRSRLNELILPTERNNYQPPVESINLCPRDGGKGTRLIIWQSLKASLRSEDRRPACCHSRCHFAPNLQRSFLQFIGNEHIAKDATLTGLIIELPARLPFGFA